MWRHRDAQALGGIPHFGVHRIGDWHFHGVDSSVRARDQLRRIHRENGNEIQADQTGIEDLKLDGWR